jgi:glycosyltransferase involved in cell wall biosynthesis
MMTHPLVSAIIPTFNRASLVCDAIDSVRQQTYRNVEIIVVDDGSTDDTEARLQRYGAQIRVIRQNNRGPSAARNRGIQASRGELVGFLDSDDTWKPQKLQHQIRILEAAGERVCCCVCNAGVHRSDGRPATTFEYAGLEDYDLALRLSLEGPWAYTCEPLAMYREDSPGSLAAAGSRNELRLLKRAILVRESFYDRVHASDRYRHLRRAASIGLKTFRRELRVLELTQHPLCTRSFLARSLLRLERHRKSLCRRTPWYPKMKVTAIVPRSDTHSRSRAAIHVH